MMLVLHGVLSPDEVASFQARLAQGDWSDGRMTAGFQSAQAKVNLQLPQDDPVALELGARVLAKLESNPLFLSAALPRTVYPPLFNRYGPGMAFGNHVDNAIRSFPGRPERLRTDVSSTLFLADPETYDGGELLVEDTYGVHRVKLPAGDMVLYPATSLHRVAEVTRGERLAAFFWTQSLVRSDEQRALLFDLDRSVQALNRDHPGHGSILTLTSTYHNLLRLWSDV